MSDTHGRSDGRGSRGRTRRRFLRGAGLAAGLGTGVTGAWPARATDSTDETSTPDELLTEVDAGGELRVGVGEATLAWRAGAKPGQVGSGPGSGYFYGSVPHSTVGTPGDGFHSEPTAKAVVIEREGERYALVKGDMYLMHAMIQRRVADHVSAVGIERDNLLVQATHNHSAPHAQSTAFAVAVFADAFDLRQWSYTTRQLARAVKRAAGNLQPAEVSAVEGSFDAVQRNIIGPAQATTMATEDTGPFGARRGESQHEPLTDEDGDPVMAGFPEDYFDDSFTVIRFDRPDGKPIAATLSLGMHPECLENGHGLTTAEYVGAVERKFQRRVQEATGAGDFRAVWLNAALGDVEPAEGDRDGTVDWWRESFGRMEELAELVTPAAFDLWKTAGNLDTEEGTDRGSALPPEAAARAKEPRGDAGPPSEAGGDDSDSLPEGIRAAVPARRDVVVDAATVELPPPEDRPWGPDSSYISEQGGQGLRIPSTGAAQESMSARCTVLRIGDICLAGFPGEPISDLSYNFRSRVDREGDNVYGGYHWPDEPDWVGERIESQFSTDELAPEDGFEIPVMLSVTNDWLGYFVTEWEFENRNHYRESLCPYGPESADYVVSALVDCAREVAGGDEATTRLAPNKTADDGRKTALYNALVAGEQSVREYRAGLPPAPETVGDARSQPGNHTRFERATFDWVGGSTAVDLPRAVVEQQVDGEWRAATGATSGELTVTTAFERLDEDPTAADPTEERVWTATWEVPHDAPAGTYRFTVRGEARGQPGANDHPDFFDPLAADESYEVVSEPFAVTGPGTVPAAYLEGGSDTLGFSFEPYLRNTTDPVPGTAVPVTLDGPTTVTRDAVTGEDGRFSVDVADLPAGEYAVSVPAGAWADPDGNRSAAIDATVTLG
jgi:hypothetical protein